MFQKSYQNWVEFRKRDSLLERDLHLAGEISESNYYENMEGVYATALTEIEHAQKEGYEWVLFTHGSSTSRRGNITARSQVRKAMRCKQATPFIIRKQCIQHDSVFLAKIRQIDHDD